MASRKAKNAAALEERRALESGEIHWLPCRVISRWGACTQCRVGFPQWCAGRGGPPKKKEQPHD